MGRPARCHAAARLVGSGMLDSYRTKERRDAMKDDNWVTILLVLCGSIILGSLFIYAL